MLLIWIIYPTASVYRKQLHRQVSRSFFYGLNVLVWASNLTVNEIIRISHIFGLQPLAEKSPLAVLYLFENFTRKWGFWIQIFQKRPHFGGKVPKVVQNCFCFFFAFCQKFNPLISYKTVHKTIWFCEKPLSEKHLVLQLWPTPQDTEVNGMYIKCSEDIKDISRTSYFCSIYILCPGGKYSQPVK